MGSRRAIYNDIAASTSVFFRPRQKNSLGQGRALGNFFASDEKNLGFGAISLYIALRDPIYTLHIYQINIISAAAGLRGINVSDEYFHGRGRVIFGDVLLFLSPILHNFHLCKKTERQTDKQFKLN